MFYTIVYVDNIEKCTAFYRDVLGMTVVETNNNWCRFESDGGTLVLRAQTEVHPPSGTAARFGLAVDNLNAVYRKLAGQAVKFVAPPASIGWAECATLCDPEGNPVDLIQDTSAVSKTDTAAGVSDTTVVNEILARSPDAMEVLEEHGIRICGGCIVLLNSSVRETAEYSGLSVAETFRMVEELNDKIHQRAESGTPVQP